MNDQPCLRELIAANREYQLLTDKLEIPEHWYDKTIREVSCSIRMDEKLLEAVMRSYGEGNAFPMDAVNETSTMEIVRYLEYSHRYYLTKKLPEIEQSIRHLHAQHASSHPLLAALGLFFLHYKEKLEKHIRFEEDVFFPYVKRLLALDKSSSQGVINEVLKSYSAREFIFAHTDVEEDLRMVRKTILDYSDEGKSPLPYRIFLNQLHHFETDLCRHALLEDHVLLPRILALESEILVSWKEKSDMQIG